MSPRRLRVLFLPPQAARGDSTTGPPGSDPDPCETDRLFTAEGIDLIVVAPTGRPFNPFAGKHPMLEGLDLWRALRVMLFERHADLVLTISEAPAVPLILLRRLFGFRTPIVLTDLSPAERWRLRKRLQDFVAVRGSGYFFLPGRAAMRFLAHGGMMAS